MSRRPPALRAPAPWGPAARPGLPSHARALALRSAPLPSGRAPGYFVLSSENPVKDINKMLRYFKDEDAARNTKVNGGSAIEMQRQWKSPV